MSRTRKFTEGQRELVCQIAHEAHTLGRIYTEGGEKLNPAVEFDRIRRMANASMQAGRVVFNLATAARGKP